MENPKIVTQLKAVIQADVLKSFGRGEVSNRGLESVRKYAQQQLDGYLKEVIKQSPDLQKVWAMDHPFKAVARLNLNTRNYEIDITTKDSPGIKPEEKI